MEEVHDAGELYQLNVSSDSNNVSHIVSLKGQGAVVSQW